MNDTSPKRIPTATERGELARVFRSWTADAAVADELAQQTIIEAWQGAQPDHDSEWRPWLFGVARNILFRWRRSLSMEQRRHILVPDHLAVIETLASPASIDEELELSQIRSLLHDMLDTLPAETRRVLMLKYIQELPQTEIAALLGINEKALEGRLHRGKQKLRSNVLMYRPDTAVDLGIVREANVWQTSDIWCPLCGTRLAHARWSDDGVLTVACPDCEIHRNQSIKFFESDRVGPTMSNRKAMLESLRLERDQLARGRESVLPCSRCGGDGHPIIEDRYLTDQQGYLMSMTVVCDDCGSDICTTGIAGIAVFSPYGVNFLANNHRVRVTENRRESWQGRDTVHFRWESIDNHHHLDAHIDTTDWTLLEVLVDDSVVHRM